MSENIINETVVGETVTQESAVEDTLKYYKVESSHWTNVMEFSSRIPLTEGQCFRIKMHSGGRPYPTRLKVLEISDTSSYHGNIVEILEVDTDVEPF